MNLVSSKQMLSNVRNLYTEEKYTEINNQLSDEVLEFYKDAELYAFKSRSSTKLSDLEQGYKYAQIAIELNPMAPDGYLARGSSRNQIGQYLSGIADYNMALSLDDSIWEAWSNKGMYYLQLKEYNLSIEAYTSALRLNKKFSKIYYGRGKAYYKFGKYKEALKDFNKAITIDNRISDYYNYRGLAYYNQNKNTQALSDFEQAISLSPTNSAAYHNIGLIKEGTKKYQEAITALTKAIQLDNDSLISYYIRGSVYSQIGRYDAAIDDLVRYIETDPEGTQFFLKQAKSQLIELERKLKNVWYDEIDKSVQGIKQNLLFKENSLTHFTSLSSAKFLILNESPFRLSEGNFLNDTSEGRELFNFLSNYSIVTSHNDTVAKGFVERPFIGSFVADSKHDDLALWRMYGKEKLSEAKGCALTFDRIRFIDKLKESLKIDDSELKELTQKKNEFSFYKVAYCNKEKFKVPGHSASKESKLNLLLKKLKQQVDALTKMQRPQVAELLNSIAYLFKTADYQYEYEVRLVISGVGFKKEIEIVEEIPRVYINLVGIVPFVSKITLGPKVDRPDEWASTFYYKIDELEPNKEESVEIVISQLPFK